MSRTSQTFTVSSDPLDYGMKRYSDLEVADHSIMIQNLPKNVPRRELEKRLKKMFERVLGCETQPTDTKKKPKSSFLALRQ